MVQHYHFLVFNSHWVWIWVTRCESVHVKCVCVKVGVGVGVGGWRGPLFTIHRPRPLFNVPGL